MPRSRRRFATCTLICTLLAVLGYGGWWLAQAAPIGTAYAAKVLCSSVFVSGRDPQQVVENDILADNHPLLRLVQARVDSARRRTSATFLGFALRQAQYRPGFGCTLAIGVAPEALAQGFAPLDGPAPGADPLPPAAAQLSPMERERLTAALDWAFDEPDRNHLRRTRAVVVLRHGQLAAERYASGFGPDTPMPGWSMTKTITAALAGVLVGQGRLRLESTALLPQWTGAGDPRAAISLDHLLRLTDGLAFSERSGDPLSDTAVMLFASPGAAAFAASRPLGSAPGTTWRYANGTSNALMQVLRVAHGETDESFVQWPRRALFDRIGMRSAVLELDALGIPVASSFAQASPRDWARFGQFLLQDGVWNGERILPPGWVHYMTTPTPLCPRRDFGAHVWVRVPDSVNSQAPAPPALPPDMFHLSGHEGQLVSVIPSRRLVVVRLGLTRARHAWDHEAFLARVLGSLSD
jgi:CubicO group peptidase (beta-lactamase class C family)